MPQRNNNLTTPTLEPQTAITEPHVGGFRRRAIAAIAGISLALSPVLTACDDNGGGQPNLPAPSGTSSLTGGERTTQPEQLNIAGNWDCTMSLPEGLAKYTFTITSAGEQWKMARDGANDETTGRPKVVDLPVAIEGNTISWLGDIGNNAAGWDVTINLHDGNLDGASGSCLNHYNNKTYAITSCKPNASA